MIEYLRPEITAWCVSAAVLLVEHLICAPRAVPYWLRYILGVAAIGIGIYALERLSGRPAGFRGFFLISSSGLVVLAAYGLRYIYGHAIKAAKDAGYIKGRADEANRRTTGVARHRND